MRTESLVRLIKEAARSHFASRYRKGNNLSFRGRSRTGVKLAEDGDVEEKSDKKKKTDTGVDSTPNTITINPTLTSTNQAR